MGDSSKPKIPDSVHAGESAAYPHFTLTTPINQTATYAFDNTAALVEHMEGKVSREEYGRYGNPTVGILEQKLRELEGAEDSAAFSSGMAAMTSTLFALLQQGSHVVLYADCYRRTRQFITQTLSRFGVSHTLVDPGDVNALKDAITEKTRLVISEAPTNPYLMVIDIPKMVEICKAKRVKTMIDATFATPVNLRPIDLGVDLVLHSATKYLAGHNDVLAGVISGKAGLISLARELRDVTGAVCDPHAAYLAIRGVKTLGLRIAHQNASALAIATYLEGHPRIARVFYPGLASHPSHTIATRLMKGFGGVVSFEVKGDLKSTSNVVDRLRIPKIAPSFGGVESLVEQPAIMSYFELSSEERNAIGIRDTLIRYSVGIEDHETLIADLDQALEQAQS